MLGSGPELRPILLFFCTLSLTCRASVRRSAPLLPGLGVQQVAGGVIRPHFARPRASSPSDLDTPRAGGSMEVA